MRRNLFMTTVAAAGLGLWLYGAGTFDRAPPASPNWWVTTVRSRGGLPLCVSMTPEIRRGQTHYTAGLIFGDKVHLIFAYGDGSLHELPHDIALQVDNRLVMTVPVRDAVHDQDGAVLRAEFPGLESTAQLLQALLHGHRLTLALSGHRYVVPVVDFAATVRKLRGCLDRWPSPRPPPPYHPPVRTWTVGLPV